MSEGSRKWIGGSWWCQCHDDDKMSATVLLNECPRGEWVSEWVSEWRGSGKWARGWRCQCHDDDVGASECVQVVVCALAEWVSEWGSSIKWVVGWWMWWYTCTHMSTYRQTHGERHSRRDRERRWQVLKWWQSTCALWLLPTWHKRAWDFDRAPQTIL